jgi:thiamine-phosphate pyrophosphorylase
MRPISKLHFITTSAALAEEACKGSIDWIQLRLKNVSYDEYFAVGKEVQEVCRKYNATFIINDNVQLALDLDADGVHVGKEDPLTAKHITELLDRRRIIGCTANTIDDLAHLAGKEVSYIGLGPFRFTATKQNLSPVLGIDGYVNIFAAAKNRVLDVPPIIGIGGITENDVPALMATGLHGVAVSGAIANAANIQAAVRGFKNKLINF